MWHKLLHGSAEKLKHWRQNIESTKHFTQGSIVMQWRRGGMFNANSCTWQPHYLRDNVFNKSINKCTHTHTHTHSFNSPFSVTTQVSRYQKGKTNVDFTETRDSEWQWHQLGHMQVSSLLQTDNHANTSLLSFLQAGCPSCHPTNSVKALKAQLSTNA